MRTISAIVITYNESRNIEACLKTASWCDEIVVIDAESTDDTVEKARAFTEYVYVTTWLGFAEAKNYALRQASSDWILWIDADERISDELRDEIKRCLEDPDHRYVAYAVPRKAYFLGRWIKHCGWYPDYVTRLFRRDRGRFDQARVHEDVVIDGKSGRLSGHLEHYTDPNLFHYFRKFNQYTSLAAEDLFEYGRRLRLRNLVLRPFFTFFRMYILRSGFRDGMEGFILCVLSASYVFAKYAKLWEFHRHEQERLADAVIPPNVHSPYLEQDP